MYNYHYQLSDGVEMGRPTLQRPNKWHPISRWNPRVWFTRARFYRVKQYEVGRYHEVVFEYATVEQHAHDMLKQRFDQPTGGKL